MSLYLLDRTEWLNQELIMLHRNSFIFLEEKLKLYEVKPFC